MKWSDDGSEVTLSAAEFAAQTAAFAALNTKRLEAETTAHTCNNLLNEAIKKDVTIRRTVELKEGCDHKTEAQRVIISAAKGFMTTLMNAFLDSHHEEGCPCDICDKRGDLRTALEVRAKKVYSGECS